MCHLVESIWLHILFGEAMVFLPRALVKLSDRVQLSLAGSGLGLEGFGFLSETKVLLLTDRCWWRFS